ncbi:MAG: DUF4838 domain-containing protein [Armatimonadetes bacterium]|nr:DUF4838 domain-containing protein [Armatimonadota bacterium]
MFRYSRPLNRRRFMNLAAASALSLAGLPRTGAASPLFFKTRGLVLSVMELEAMDCPALASKLGINTLDLAHQTDWAAKSDLGQKTLADCRRLKIEVEFSMHAPGVFLPRELYDKDPSMFRMDEQGNRVREGNLCVHSENALEIFCENAVKNAQLVRPTTGRYYYWIDDGQPMCRCPKCRELSDSDQALLLERRLLKALRRIDRNAALSHLAYARTMPAPSKIQPEKGIFLQFAPIERDSFKPLEDAAHARLMERLDANLSVFGREGSQALEYWMDNSRFSGWKEENIRRVPWRQDIFLSDLAAYARRGIRHIRTYAVWFDAKYVRNYGPPPFDEYAAGLKRWRLERGKAVERP